MKRLVFLAVAVIALVVAASAFASDRNRDPDGDDVSNRAEFRHHTNPRDADTDNDGVRDGDEIAERTNPRDDDSDNDGKDDGDEVAGKVKSFDGTTLVITLNDNSEVSGAVTDATEIECEGNEDSHTASLRHDGGDDNSGPGSTGEDNSGPGSTGDDDQGDDNDDQDENENACTKADLVAGTTVHEAELKTTTTGKAFKEVDLVK